MKKHNDYDNDAKYAEFLYAKIENAIFHARFMNLLGWYIRKVYTYKYLYITTAALSLLIDTSIIIIGNFAEPKWVNLSCTVLAAASGLSTGFVLIFRWKDHWIRCRINIEKLKSLASTYLFLLKQYEGDINKLNELNEEYIMHLEKIALEENSLWYRLYQKDNT